MYTRPDKLTIKSDPERTGLEYGWGGNENRRKNLVLSSFFLDDE